VIVKGFVLYWQFCVYVGNRDRARAAMQHTDTSAVNQNVNPPATVR
jgi:hypothetical protein